MFLQTYYTGKSTKLQSGGHYILSNKFEGKLSSFNEGEVYWTEIDDMKKSNLADGMEKMLEVFLKENLSEYFFYKENNKWVDVLK